MSSQSNTSPAQHPGRITVEESFLDLIDQSAYGNLETWCRVYATALADPAMRASVVRAAAMVDPDFASAGALWRTLVDHMPPVVSRATPIATPAAAEPADRTVRRR